MTSSAKQHTGKGTVARGFFCLYILACTPLIAQEPLFVSPTDVSPTDISPADVSQNVTESIQDSCVAQTLCDAGFWFVNTHHSPQSFDRTCPKFCPAVMRYEQCAKFRHSSFQEMVAGLESGVPVCIMIHGSFVDTPGSCRESVCTWKWLKNAGMGQQMQMIYFHWPSYRRLSPLVGFDTNQLGRRASRNGYYLAELIQHVPPECPICLLGHSHGTRVIASGLHLLAGGAIQGVRHPFARVNGRCIRTVFTASALDHHWLNPGKRYDRALCSTQCMLNLTNRHDPALITYPLRLPLLARPPLGITGLTGMDRRRLGRRGEKVLDFDVTAAVGASHLWPYYFQQPGLAMAMRNYVYFPDRMTPATVARNSETVTTR